jgi:hypothetical protein
MAHSRWPHMRWSRLRGPLSRRPRCAHSCGLPGISGCLGMAVLLGLGALLAAPAIVAGAAPGAPPDAAAETADTIDLVRGGRSAYSIRVDPQASPVTLAVADTLRRYIQAISGAQLAVTSETAASPRQIVLEAGRSRRADLDPAAFGRDGFRIHSEGVALYLTAGTDHGLQNAVYTFIETYLGCRKYSPTVTVVPRRADITIPAIDDTQVPPIAFRMQNFHDPAYDAWHKLDNNDDFGLFVHTFRVLVPPERYFAEHPEYFSLLNGHRTPDGQLCLTNPDVYRVVVEELRARMKERPEATFWSVSQNDTYAPCECAACRAIDEAEGSPSGSLLAFVNRVADAFPQMRISTLAYQYTRAAPKHLRPRSNVNIMLCSIECNRSRPLAEDPGSADFVRDVEDWSKITKDILLWDYVIQFRNLVSPFPNLRVLQPNIRFFVRNGITSVFEQGLAAPKGEFAELRGYLIAKLLWNPDANVDSLMTDFLQGYYGAAAPHIRRYIDTMHGALAMSGEGLDIYGYPRSSADGYLSPERMQEYRVYFDGAEAAVAHDPEYLVRVRTARLPIEFAELEQAKVRGAAEGGAFVSDPEGRRVLRPGLDGLLARFTTGCREAAIPILWEHGTTPDQYEASTRRFFDEGIRAHIAYGRPVALEPPASPKYHGGEASALVDGIKGWDDYYFHWLGFEGTDMEATIDLGEPRTVTQVDTDFLQDINSWVFMPLQVRCSLSEDGRTFVPIGEIVNTVPQEKWGPIVAPFGFSCEPTRARHVRIAATSVKTCPTWHKGSGGPAWIFVDEIAVR